MGGFYLPGPNPLANVPDLADPFVQERISRAQIEQRVQREGKALADEGARLVAEEVANSRARAQARKQGFTTYKDASGRTQLIPEGDSGDGSALVGAVTSPHRPPAGVSGDVAKGPSPTPMESLSKLEEVVRTEHEKGPGIRFAVKGKWYEQTDGGYVPVDKYQSDRGDAFRRTGPGAAPSEMDSIRREVRSQGAFGRDLPERSGPGGFSPSPKVTDVAVLPQSALEDATARAQLKSIENASRGAEQVPSESLPEALRGLADLGLTREQALQLILAGLSHPQRSSKVQDYRDEAQYLQGINQIYKDRLAQIESSSENEGQKASDKADLDEWAATQKFPAMRGKDIPQTF